jgi:hypothetical protein
MGLRKWQNIFIQLVWVSAISCCCLTIHSESYASEKSQPAAEGKLKTERNIQKQPFEPPHPSLDDFDWIQLDSGEWLKGELKVLYDKKLEFDSDELDLLEFDWEDVKYVRSSRIISIRFEGPEGPNTVKGILVVNENKVIVTNGEEIQEFDRSRLVAMAPGAPKEINYWSVKITFGLTLTGGNTEQFQWATIANIKRRTSATRFVIDWLGNFSETEGEQTINNKRVTSHFDVFKTRKYYFTPFFGEYLRDPFVNIKRRITVGAGMGYHIIETSKTEWDVGGGPAYQQTRFESVPVEQDTSEVTAALVIGSHFNTELTKAVDLDLLYNFQIVNKESGTYNHHFIATLETEITNWLDFDVSFVWDRIRDPQPNADGTVPEQDDYYLILGLGVDF